jgi:hypothetical protein
MTTKNASHLSSKRWRRSLVAPALVATTLSCGNVDPKDVKETRAAFSAPASVTWNYVANAIATAHIAGCRDGNIFAEEYDGSMWVTNSLTNGWTSLGQDPMGFIALGCAGTTLYGLDGTGIVWRNTGGSTYLDFQKVTQSATPAAFGISQTATLPNVSKSLYWFLGYDGSFYNVDYRGVNTAFGTPGNIAHIGTGGGPLFVIRTNGDLCEATSLSPLNFSCFDNVPDTREITATNANTLWAINNDGSMWRGDVTWTGGGGPTPSLPTSLFTINGATAAGSGAFTTLWDNPTITAWEQLRASVEEVDTTSDDAAWVSYNFRLLLTSSGPDARGGITTPGNGFAPWPLAAGTLSYPSWLHYIGHGLQLGYGQSTVQATHQFLNLSRQVSAQATISLDPQVFLVPIQVMRVMPPTSYPAYGALASTTDQRLKQLFDDDPAPSIFVSGGGQINTTTNYSYRQQGFPWLQPDPLFLGCGIQFRMVGCNGQAGCPDINVTDPSLTDPVGTNNCRAQGDALKANIAAAKNMPGVNKNLPIVVVMNTVDCDKEDLGQVGSMGIPLQNSEMDDITTLVAHELGHVVGMGDDFSGTSLMSPDGNAPHNLRPAQCCVARRAIAQNLWTFRQFGGIPDANCSTD